MFLSMQNVIKDQCIDDEGETTVRTKILTATTMSVLVLIILGIGSCHWGAGRDSVTKVGVIYPLTGDAASWGQNARNGAMLALDDFNSHVGDPKQKVEVILEDSKSTPKDAVAAANKLIFQDKVRFIVGDLVSSDLLAIAPISQTNKVLTVGQGSSPKVNEAGDYIFSTWPSDDLQGQAVAKCLNETLKAANASIIYVNNEYGKGVVDVLKRFYKGSVDLEDGYDSKTRDFRNIIQKVPKTSKALVLVAYPEELPILLKQLSEANITVPVVGTETFENENVKKLNTAYPIYYTLPKFADKESDKYKQFVARYKAKYGAEPGVPADVAYDAMMLVLEGIAREGYDPEKVRSTLSGLKNYQGVSGIITFNRSGNVLKPFQIKQLQNGKESIAGQLEL
jgi:branched-chain amino acid transport system substrate-binding protein